MTATSQSETQRVQLQDTVDRSSTQEARYATGQHPTPTDLALQILRYAADRLPRPGGRDRGVLLRAPVGHAP